MRWIAILEHDLLATVRPESQNPVDDDAGDPNAAIGIEGQAVGFEPPDAAGGGAEVCNRIVSAEMQNFLPVRINFTNKPGGFAGSIGMSYVYSQPADGYTIVGLWESVIAASVRGGWDQKMDVWYPFIIAGSPDVISVSADAPYASLTELIDAAKADPGAIKASAGGAGSIHHLNLLALMEGTGAKLNFIPYPGSAPAQTAAMTGEVSVVVTSLAEQQQLIKGGKLRALGMLVPEPFMVEGVGEIPSAFTACPELSKHLPIGQAIGMAVRAHSPDDVKAVLTDAFNKAFEKDALKNWAKDNFCAISGQTGGEAAAEFARLESLFGWTLYELGAAKIDPADLGIPKP